MISISMIQLANCFASVITFITIKSSWIVSKAPFIFIIFQIRRRFGFICKFLHESPIIWLICSGLFLLIYWFRLTSNSWWFWLASESATPSTTLACWVSSFIIRTRRNITFSFNTTFSHFKFDNWNTTWKFASSLFII